MQEQPHGYMVTYRFNPVANVIEYKVSKSQLTRNTQLEEAVMNWTSLRFSGWEMECGQLLAVGESFEVRDVAPEMEPRVLELTARLGWTRERKGTTLRLFPPGQW